jgi:hypothetical protein
MDAGVARASLRLEGLLDAGREHCEVPLADRSVFRHPFRVLEGMRRHLAAKLLEVGRDTGEQEEPSPFDSMK